MENSNFVLNVNGEIDKPFHRHSVCLDPDNLSVFVFGGESEEKIMMKLAYLFDLSTNSWDILTKRFKDEIKIDSHSCILHEGHFYIYGGNDSSTFLNKSCVYKIKVSPFSIDVDRIFDEEYKDFEKKESGGSSEKKEKIPPSPLSRIDHVAVVVGSQMIIHGGRSKENTKVVLSDCWSFDLKQKVWKKLGDFVPLCCHSAIFDGKNGRVVVFGGRSEVGDYSNLTYEITGFPKTKVEEDCEKEKIVEEKKEGFDMTILECTNEHIVAPREKCSMSLYKDKFSIVYGGWTFGALKNDLILLDLETNEWKTVEKSIGQGVCGHGAVVHKNNLLIFGGLTNHGILSDIFKIPLLKVHVM